MDHRNTPNFNGNKLGIHLVYPYKSRVFKIYVMYRIMAYKKEKTKTGI